MRRGGYARCQKTMRGNSLFCVPWNPFNTELTRFFAGRLAKEAKTQQHTKE